MNPRLTDHPFEGFWRVKFFCKLNLDEPVRLAVDPAFHPGLGMFKFIVKIETILFKKLCDVLIRPVG